MKQTKLNLFLNYKSVKELFTKTKMAKYLSSMIRKQDDTSKQFNLHSFINFEEEEGENEE